LTDCGNAIPPEGRLRIKVIFSRLIHDPEQALLLGSCVADRGAVLQEFPVSTDPVSASRHGRNSVAGVEASVAANNYVAIRIELAHC
jgi:hypothetical protein